MVTLYAPPTRIATCERHRFQSDPRILTFRVTFHTVRPDGEAFPRFPEIVILNPAIPVIARNVCVAIPTLRHQKARISPNTQPVESATVTTVSVLSAELIVVRPVLSAHHTRNPAQFEDSLVLSHHLLCHGATESLSKI